MLLISVDGLHQQDLAWYVRTHPAYQILSGPSGTGVQDYFTPEIVFCRPARPNRDAKPS